MDRRAFVTGLGTLLAGPLAAEAQQAGKVWRIGVLFGGTPTADMAGPEPRSAILRSFLEGLRELGYVEGQNVVIERRSAEGTTQRLPDLFGELVRLNVDVILASGGGLRAGRTVSQGPRPHDPTIDAGAGGSGH
jgi:putative ABC transport system substrate-binding protein